MWDRRETELHEAPSLSANVDEFTRLVGSRWFHDNPEADRPPRSNRRTPYMFMMELKLPIDESNYISLRISIAKW